MALTSFGFVPASCMQASTPRFPDPETRPELRMLELFAGVGGFRLALRESGWTTVWANQWEPGTKAQHAFDCYTRNFGYSQVHVNEDIAEVLRSAAGDPGSVPDHDLVVGGFPCQDYSVAKTLNQAHGIEGKKGVLWWEIHRLLDLKRPRLVFLENVDRLLKSPAAQRGRDFAVMLACLSALDYAVEWRVVNAADYGFPQKRRRVFIVARKNTELGDLPVSAPMEWLCERGVLARALPVKVLPEMTAQVVPLPSFVLDADPAVVSQSFGRDQRKTPFGNSGVMYRSRVWTRDVEAAKVSERITLGDILQDEGPDTEPFLIPGHQLGAWRTLKGAKDIERCHKASGTAYTYSEGALPFPDPLDRPARTILTGEGGSSPSRFKHVVERCGRYRRLTPIELERLNGFPDGWTEGMTSGRRAFCMGNALVVGLVSKVGRVLAEDQVSWVRGRASNDKAGASEHQSMDEAVVVR